MPARTTPAAPQAYDGGEDGVLERVEEPEAADDDEEHRGELRDHGQQIPLGHLPVQVLERRLPHRPRHDPVEPPLVHAGPGVVVVPPREPHALHVAAAAPGAVVNERDGGDDGEADAAASDLFWGIWLDDVTMVGAVGPCVVLR